MSQDSSHTNRIARVIEKRKKRIRLETFGILSLGIAAGWSSSLLLFHWGLTALWLRYLISAAVGYVLFVVLYSVWMKFVLRDLAANLQRYDEEKGPRTGNGDGIDFDLPGFDGLDFELAGILIGLLALTVAVVFVVATAPALLLDVVTSEVVLLLLTKRVVVLDDTAVFWGVVKRTVVGFLVLSLVLALWGLGLQLSFPGAESLADVLARCFAW